MTPSKESFSKIIQLPISDVSEKDVQMLQAMALVDIAEALTGLLKLAKETGEPYQEEGR